MDLTELNLSGLGAVNIIPDGPHRIWFRLDPGTMFLVRGQLRIAPGGAMSASIWLQDRPENQLSWIASVTASPESLKDGYAELAGYMSQWGPRLHWLDCRCSQAPAWTRTWPAAELAVARDSVSARAADKGIAHYLWRQGERIVAGNNPPDPAPFMSVTPLGEWSAHDPRRTRPLETVPDLTDFSAVTAHRLARLAARDHAARSSAIAERTTTPPPRDSSTAPRRRR